MNTLFIFLEVVSNLLGQWTRWITQGLFMGIGALSAYQLCLNLGWVP